VAGAGKNEGDLSENSKITFPSTVTPPPPHTLVFLALTVPSVYHPFVFSGSPVSYAAFRILLN
jgi:hypothetical protein